MIICNFRNYNKTAMLNEPKIELIMDVKVEEVQNRAFKKCGKPRHIGRQQPKVMKANTNTHTRHP